MKFNRRSFFGLIPGAAFGGKQAVVALAAEAEKLALGSVGGAVGLGPPTSPYPDMAVSRSSAEWAQRRLLEFTNAAERVRRWEQTIVTRIDPDLVSMRSLSLSAKMAMQKQRDFDRHEKSQTTYFEGVIAGIFDR